MNTRRSIRLKHATKGGPIYGLNVRTEEYRTDGVRLLRTTDISDDGELKETAEPVFVDRMLGLLAPLQTDDLLLSRSGTVGRALRVREDMLPVTHAGYLVRFRPDRDRISPSFLEWAIRSQSFQDQVQVSGTQSTIINVNAQRYATMTIPDHPLATQQLIADFLDRETQRIDTLIDAKRRMIDLLEEKRRAAIDHAMHGDGTWPRVALQHLVDPRRPITYGIVLPGPNVDRGVPIIKSGDVKPGRLHPDRLDRTTVEIESRYLRSRVRPGDIVYSIRGSVGTVEIVPESLPVANLTQDTARVAPAGHVSRDWLLFALRSSIAFSELEAGMTGAAVKGINIFSLNKLRLQVPPLEIQRSIAAELTEVTSRIDAAERAVAIQLALLAEYRQALITKAVTGQLDEATLKGKKPADEVVSV